MFDLKGKKALVTGSTQGIGFAVAKLLANCGAEIIIHGATSEEKCRKAAEKILGKTQIAVANLADSDCAENLYRQTGDIDILVLNASVQIRKPWDETTAEEFELQIHTNLKSSLMLIQKYAKHMLCIFLDQHKRGFQVGMDLKFKFFGSGFVPRLSYLYGCVQHQNINVAGLTI